MKLCGSLKAEATRERLGMNRLGWIALEEKRKEDDSNFCCAMHRLVRSQRYRKNINLQGLAGDAEGGLDRLSVPCHTCTTSIYVLLIFRR